MHKVREARRWHFYVSLPFVRTKDRPGILQFQSLQSNFSQQKTMGPAIVKDFIVCSVFCIENNKPVIDWELSRITVVRTEQELLNN